MRTTLFAGLLGLMTLFESLPCFSARPVKPTPPRQDASPPREQLVLNYLTLRERSTLAGHPFAQTPSLASGVDGAQLGIDDDNTTGQFTHQGFSLEKIVADNQESALALFRERLNAGYRVFLLDLPVDLTLELTRLESARSSILLDVTNSDDRLRGIDCAPNLFTLMPSDAMRSDALAQYLAKKRWQRWFLAYGSESSDLRVAEAVRGSAKKFGLKLVVDKPWTYHFEDRRTPESEVPVFTQGDDYDLLILIDSQKSFADLFAYRTWLPRPVAGSAGLSATAWHPGHDAWGALQLQSRFKEKFGRVMEEKDYTAWLGARIIAEAGTRAHSLSSQDLLTQMTSDAFSIAGFKGVPLSFRPWDHQLRQPVLLGGERAVIAVAPIEGYLHPKNTLDTLGKDQAESACIRPETGPTVR